MKISGAHTIIYGRDAEADREFFRDVLEFPHVDVGIHEPRHDRPT